MTVESFRTFVALNLPHSLHAGIEQIQRHLRYLPGASAIRWTPVNKLHLTLEFLGDVDVTQIDKLTAALAQVCKSEIAKLHIDGAGCFPSIRKPSVVWLGLRGDTEILCTLQAKIREVCRPFESNSDNKPFVPHLTIGRVKNGAFKTARLFGPALAAESKKISLPEIWQASHIELIRSQMSKEGALYTPLATFNL